MIFGTNIAKDGLVFGYDTGYPIVTNSDGYKFYRGEPTTNVLNNTIMGTGNGAYLSSDEIGTYIQLANLTSSYSRFQLPSISVSSNDVYTWSFELMSLETISTGYYFEANEYSNQFPTNNDNSRVGFTQSTPSTLPAGEWIPFRLTVTMKDGLTGAYTYDFFNMTYPTFQNKKIYYRNMQFEFNEHKTQYVGQGGSRTVTDSLIDLRKNTIIDLSNVSFDSNALMTFDGSDDYIDLADSLYNISGELSFEIVFKIPSSTGENYLPFMDWHVGTTSKGYLSSGNFTSGHPDESISFYNSQTTAITFSYLNGYSFYHDDNYHHVIITCGRNNYSIWVDGASKPITFRDGSQDTIFPDIFNGDASMESFIGKYGPGGVYKGDMPIFKIYNKILSDVEKLQNYNAYKERFKI